jgi:hypothetical protein
VIGITGGDADSFYGDLSFLACGEFELDFLLNSTADPDYCDELDVLPTDLVRAIEQC